MGASRSDECAECVLVIVQPRYLVKLAVAGAVHVEFITNALHIHLLLRYDVGMLFGTDICGKIILQA